MNLIKETMVIFADEIVQSLKTKKALVTIVTYMALMFLGLKIGSYFEIIVWIYAEMKKSFSVMLPYYVSVIIIPLFCILVGYNTISKEMNLGSIRFIAYRVRRVSILLGKTLSSAWITFVMVGIAYIIATVYIYQKTGLLYYMQSLIAWAYLGVYALCFICMVNLISMITKKTGSSIIWSLFATVFFVFILNYDHLKYASPFYYAKGGLSYIIDGDLTTMLFSMLILALYAFLFFSLSWLLIEKSDL